MDGKDPMHFHTVEDVMEYEQINMGDNTLAVLDHARVNGCLFVVYSARSAAPIAQTGRRQYRQYQERYVLIDQDGKHKASGILLIQTVV